MLCNVMQYAGKCIKAFQGKAKRRTYFTASNNFSLCSCKWSSFRVVFSIKRWKFFSRISQFHPSMMAVSHQDFFERNKQLPNINIKLNLQKEVFARLRFRWKFAPSWGKINREFIHKYLIKQREEKWLSGTFGGKKRILVFKAFHILNHIKWIRREEEKNYEISWRKRSSKLMILYRDELHLLGIDGLELPV